jgi:hypothetical protein
VYRFSASDRKQKREEKRKKRKEEKKNKEEQRRTKKRKETSETRREATINRRKRSRDDRSLCQAIYFFHFCLPDEQRTSPDADFFFAAAGEEVQREIQEEEQQEIKKGRSRDERSLCRTFIFFHFSLSRRTNNPRTPIFFAAAGRRVEKEPKTHLRNPWDWKGRRTEVLRNKRKIFFLLSPDDFFLRNKQRKTKIG